MNSRAENRLARRPATMTVCLALLLAAALRSFADEIVLENQSFLAAFNRDSGALTRLENKPLHWVLERRPELGVSFRLHAPMPARRDNFVLGQKQHANKVERLSMNQMRLEWKNPASEHGGVLPITFEATISLTNDALSFEGSLLNDSAVAVESVDYPYFGDLNPPSRDSSLAARTMWYGSLGSDNLYPEFRNGKGYWGVNYPTKTFDSKRSLFCLIQAPHQGLYVEMANPYQPYLLQYTFEQHPGLQDSVTASVPRQDEFAGQPVHLEFRTCHFIFAQPHSTAKLAPVVLRCYEGDWHAGVDLYKQWRSTWFKPPHLPDWAKDVHSWAMLRMNTPEEDYTIPYTNLVKFGEEYAANGVSAVQLVGWNVGGQDRDDPSQDTDPNLGTWQELHDSIAATQAKGVKVILFGKLGWGDKTTAWYTNELHKYAACDPFGIPYEQGGYSYVTPTQLAGINNRRRAVMDFLSPGYRRIAANEFQKILRLKAAGWLFDEVCHHSNADYNFASGHGYPPPGFVYGGDLPLAAELRALADGVNPDFLFSGEGPQDWLTQYYPVSETGVTAVPICQYIDCHLPLLAGVSGFDDREMLNLILLYHYVIQYEPYYYKGHLGDFPLTLAYGKKIDALRKRYRAYLWDADFRDNLGASVTAQGCRWTVFVTSAGKHAVLVANTDANKPITATVKLSEPGTFEMVTPEHPDPQPTEGILHIPPRSVAVLMQQ